LKPGNIFLTQLGDFKIGDFGASKDFSSAGTETATLAGTKCYFSYELKKAFMEIEMTGETKARLNWYKSDVISLALIILNMLRLVELPPLNIPATAVKT